MSDERDMARGARAQSLLNDPLIVEGFDSLEAAYVEAWKASPPRDTEGRERLFQAVQIVGKIRSHLEQVMVDGKLAQATVDEIGRTPAAHRK